MKLFRSLRAALLMRRVFTSVKGIEAQLTEQNVLLKRLADHFAPIFPEQAQATASVDFVDPTTIVLTDAFVARTQREQGRPPTDDEIDRFLADESTLEMAARLRPETLQ